MRTPSFLRLNILAIFAGVIVNFGLQRLLKSLSVFMLEERVTHGKTHLLPPTIFVAFYTLLVIQCAGADFVGGYAAGKIAKRAQGYHGIAMGIASCIIAGSELLYTAHGLHLRHPFITPLTYILAVPSAYWGARTARLQANRVQSEWY